MSFIHTPTNNLQDSVEFYQKLNFKTLSGSDPVIITDGKAVIEINPDRYARAGIKLFRDDWSETVEKLDKYLTVHRINNGFMLSDPTGTRVYLIEGTPPVEVNPEEECFGMTGNFAGLSLETTEMQRSVEIWNILGFNHQQGSADQGWISLANQDGFAVSLMKSLSCPHLFFNPSMTYFNGNNNLQVIQNIRDAGIPITEEITHFNQEGVVDNIIIRDPGGYGFFIFSD